MLFREDAESLSLQVFKTLQGKAMSEMTWCSWQHCFVEAGGPAVLHRFLPTTVLMSLWNCLMPQAGTERY